MVAPPARLERATYRLGGTGRYPKCYPKKIQAATHSMRCKMLTSGVSSAFEAVRLSGVRIRAVAP
jgi:hypothetical protein